MPLTPPISAGNVTAFAPELIGRFDDEAMADVLAFANDAVDSLDLDPSTQRLAAIFLAAHLCTTTRIARSGQAGPLTSEAAGGIRASYGMLANPSLLGSTLYGQNYLAILRSSLAACPVVP